MTKELVTIEFIYLGVPKGVWDSEHKTKTITIGVFDSFEEACQEGNKVLQILEKKIKKHVFPDGREAVPERFSKNGGCFESEKRLISDLAYLKTPFSFFAKITKLKFDSIIDSIEEILDARKRYSKHQKQEQCQ